MSSTEELRILKVAVLPPSPFDCCLDYLPPKDNADIQLGTRVRVALGRTKRIGIVVGESNQSAVALNRLKRIGAVLDEEPLLPSDLLKLLMWASSYYHYPINQVLSSALPELVAKGEPLREEYPTVWSLDETVARGELPDLPKRAHKQKQLLDFLREKGIVDERTLNECLGNWRPVMKALADKGLVVSRPLIYKGRFSAPPYQLNDNQKAVAKAISQSLGKFSCEVLEGITGSGKTEVYLQVAGQAIAADQQVAVLVPEIGLTGQTVRQFQQRFGEVVEVLHSGMTPVRRLATWSRAHSGNAKVIVGPRSAIFAPLSRLGLIVVDEEHDLSYKQQDTLRYHARDLAIKRAQLSDIPIILGSATLSLETLCQIKHSRYRHHLLKQRVRDARLPEYRLIDLCAQPLVAGLSASLQSMIQKNLDRNGQTLLFLNRRGYAPRLLCHDCRTVFECSECNIPFTFHLYNNSLHCHYCDSRQPRPTRCSQCGSSDLHAIGTGTERVEEGLGKLFPNVDIVRIDSDSIKRKGEFEEKFERVRSGQAGILVGTQMIAKGHHFPNVTLVGILGVDQKLFSTDFRALERLGQLIVQVSGRAGRGEAEGAVALQTHHPDHIGLQTLLKQGYQAFADQLLEQRKITAMPPYRYLAALRADAKASEKAYQFLRFIAKYARRYSVKGMEVLGPMPMAMEKRAGFHRAQLLLFADQRSELRQCLASLFPILMKERPDNSFAWHLDIDPMELD